MATILLEALGLRCSELILEIARKSTELKKGGILEVVADCATFEKDVRLWCEKTKKTLIWIREEGDGKMRCQIQF
jgi:tRNA 2-thiouridine synthesizing protein A